MHEPANPRDLRITTLRTIADLAEQHQLPTPLSVNFSAIDYRDGTAYVVLHLDDDQRDGVAAWADILGLPERPESVIKGEFTSVKAQAWDHGSPDEKRLWLGWQHIDVWSACDRRGGAR